MKTGIVLLSIVFLVACEYNDTQPAAPLPTREIYTFLSSGVQIGIKTYTYQHRKLIREYFEANSGYAFSKEVLYEYDLAGNLVRQRERNPDDGDAFGHIIESEYLHGLKVKQTEYYQEAPAYQFAYFYTGSRLDSTWQFNYNNSTQAFDFHVGTVKYFYNDAGQLVEKLDGLKTTFTYDDSGNVLTECQDWVDKVICPAINEYDTDGRKVKRTSRMWQGEAIEEEYVYEGNRLAEKRVWDYPMYGDINQPVITRVQYEY